MDGGRGRLEWAVCRFRVAGKRSPSYVTNKEKIAFMLTRMSESRHNAALQQAGQGSSMAIGEFGGAPVVPGGNGILLSTPLYWFYEMSHAALNPSRAWADATRLMFKNPVNPLSFTTFGKSVAAACELFERSTRRYGRPEWRIASTLVGGARADPCLCRVGTAVLPAAALRARLRAPAETAAATAAHRGADVRPFRHAPARYGRGLPAQSRRLCHRLGGCAHGPDRRGPLRSRRLHRLSDLDPARARRRDSRGRGVPAGGAGAGRGGADGERQRSLRTAFDDADGRADRHPRQSDRGEYARRAARHRVVPHPRHHQSAVSQSRLHARRLSGLPAAQRLRLDESRPPHRGAQAAVSQPRARRRRLGA